MDFCSNMKFLNYYYRNKTHLLLLNETLFSVMEKEKKLLSHNVNTSTIKSPSAVQMSKSTKQTQHNVSNLRKEVPRPKDEKLLTYIKIVFHMILIIENIFLKSVM